MPDRDDRLTTEDLARKNGVDQPNEPREREQTLGDRLREGVRELTENDRHEQQPGPPGAERTRGETTGPPADAGSTVPGAHKPADAPATSGATPATTQAEEAGPTGQTGDRPLMPPDELDDFRRRWEQVQADFVDEPRRAVKEADSLVAEAMRRLADTFATERANLEEQWERSGEADTEALRVTLQRYRSFFHRLLSA